MSKTRQNISNNHHKGPPLPILCLHDAHSDAHYLQAKLQKLGDRLWQNHGCELVFVQAPLVVAGKDRRAWWQSTDDDQQPYLGLDASLLLVKQMWMSSSFWGILGVGQGAALASLLTLWLMEETTTGDLAGVRAPPQCAIFVDGYTVLPEDMPLVSIQRLQSLHILAPGSNSIEQSQQPSDPTAVARLVTQMGGQTHVRQVAEHWSSTDCLNRMGRYIVQQKLACNSASSSPSALTVVQRALVATEQQAAQLVQQHALQNPPPSLMAVIGSQVSGWSDGAKRSLPAGGAPCPSDFVLPVHKRTAALENDENNRPSSSSSSSMQEDEHE